MSAASGTGGSPAISTRPRTALESTIAGGGPAVLPREGGRDRLTGGRVPDERGRALGRDAERADAIGRHAGEDGGEDLDRAAEENLRIVLDQSRGGEGGQDLAVRLPVDP